MRLVDELIRLSATDLANHLGCVHLSELNRAVAEGRAERPTWRDPIGDLLRERGHQHENAYLAHLRAGGGLDIVEIERKLDERAGHERTLAAMHAGADVIYQARLQGERWYGIADFLRRVERPSDLGAWSYEVTDAKLATETRAGTILQLCVYSELVAAIQGVVPEAAHVVAPHHDFKPESYRLADFSAYYRLVKRRLEAALEHARRTYPDPVSQCEVCAWWTQCDRARRRDDHLCFVAGLSRLQAKELARIDVTTLEKLGDLRNVPRPSRGSREALIRTRDQAAIQLRARRIGAPQHEILTPLGPEHGFALLPRPSSHDIFLDLEGDRLAPDGGREYLFGLLAADETARRAGATPPHVYLGVWATNAEEEKKAFELVVDLILATFREHPDMHVYHFGAYEPSTFKRLSGRYATRETELDTILRAELFVDLFTVVRHSLRASVESYSIKDLEQFYGLERKQDLRAATRSRHAIEWAIEMGDDLGLGDRPTTETQLELFDASASPRNPLTAHVVAVELYNREDCISTEKLRDWLERLRASVARSDDAELPRPDLKTGEASEQIAATADETARVMRALIGGLSEEEAKRDEQTQACRLMAHLLEWHRREDKAAYWEYFRLRDLPLEDYEEERSALAGLTFVATVDGTPRAPVNRYSFPQQDHDVRRKDEVCIPLDGITIGEVVAIDVRNHTIDIAHKGKHANERPERIFVRRHVRPGQKPAVLLEIGRWIAANGVDGPGEHRAARDLLLRRPPRFLAGSPGLRAAGALEGSDHAREPRDATARDQRVISFAAARSEREQRRAAAVGNVRLDVDPEVAQARRLGFELDRGVLPIQGPPGTGKTFTGSHVILELIKAGKKVGVTAVGHETIRNLLKAVCDRANEYGLTDFKCLHKVDGSDADTEQLHTVDDNERAARFFRGPEYPLLGGTSWLWARAEFRDSADVLFIDEAGQMSLADVLAVSAGAKSLVLLGDPQQLEQPQQAAHPPGAQASALEHLLGNRKTIPADRGLFLNQTRRLHPDICRFTAEVFYENRLASFPGLERQAVLAPPGSAAARLGSSGLVYVPVEHDGRQARSEEEVAAIVALLDDLTHGDVRWRNAKGEESPLERSHVTVVAPYNAQVTALTEALPGVRVGTVDKFQGQEAPVVIVSLTTSTPDDAPRGMDFLYSGNRLNVATSRARGLCILVGNPRLFEPDCRTPEQMRLANAFCRYRELARAVPPP
jgi:predicted RecB family nuclease